MSKTNAFENDILDHIFRNAAVANIGDASGLQPSASAGSLFISLHTADPGEAGDQTTNETSYTNYARVAVARSGAGWSLTGNLIENAALIAFPACTGGSATITHFGIGTDSSGAGNLLYKGAVTTPLAVSTGITPQFATGTLDVTED